MDPYPIRILVNGRFLQAAQVSGVQRYAGEATRRLHGLVEVRAPRGPVGALGGQLWEQVLLPGGMPRDGLLWSPANTGPLAVRRQVVTLHDIAPLEHPQWYSAQFAAWYRFLIPRLGRGAQRILTVSRWAQARIAKALALPPEKIAVIYPGAGQEFFHVSREKSAAVRRAYGLEEDYFLWAGTLEPRKNLPRLLAAWHSFNLNHPETHLVLCGSLPASGRIFRRPVLPELPPAVIRLGFVPDQDLPGLYAGARALVLPSIEEGFGLPALEAAACRTPAVLTRHSGALEILGEAALVVDPLRSDEIAAGLELLLDNDRRAALGRRAAELAAGCTWERSAADIYRLLVAEAGRGAMA